MAQVLIIDDDHHLGRMMKSLVQQNGHEAVWARSLYHGLQCACDRPFDIVFLDVDLPDGNGLDAIPVLKKNQAEPEIIIITGYGNRDGAELAINSGAWDYIQKGVSLNDLLLPLTRALQFRREKIECKPPAVLKREGIVGDSAAMASRLDQLARIAVSEATVHIFGETGTGKELFARAVHRNSPRARKAFVVLDCAAIPDHLVESILFGHVKGAFTGAQGDKAGLIKEADGGSLFLDEVGELPLTIQKKFLRVLQEQRFRPVGGQGERHSDFRLISATNRNLHEMVAAGQFRKDLLYRLRSQEIRLPTLQQRREDIKSLTYYFLDKLSTKQNLETKGIADDFWQALDRYDWPGNVRELINALESALIAAGQAPTLFATHLPNAIRIKAVDGYQAGASPTPAQRQALMPESTLMPESITRKDSAPAAIPVSKPLVPLKAARAEMIAAFERRYLKDLLAQTAGNIKIACQTAGITRQHLHKLMQKYDLQRI